MERKGEFGSGISIVRGFYGYFGLFVRYYSKRGKMKHNWFKNLFKKEEKEGHSSQIDPIAAI